MTHDTFRGTFTIPLYEDAILRRAIRSSSDSERYCHPFWAFSGPQLGLGMPLTELFAVMGGSESAGILLASTKLILTEPLRLDTTYEVSGEIVSREARQGRRLGAFELCTVGLEVRDEDRTLVLSSATAFAVPSSPTSADDALEAGPAQ